MSNLILHAGAWQASKADLASVPVPQETDSYMPIPYPRLLEELEVHIPRFGYEVKDERYALAHEGNQMFGVWTVEKKVSLNEKYSKELALAIGIRSSYDSSLAVNMVMGTRVFVCDNLAFSGEIGLNRKHTRNLFRDLPDSIYSMLSRASSLEEGIFNEIDFMKARDLSILDADHLLIESVRRNVLPASDLPKVIQEWEEPKHQEFEPRNAWSLFNAYTEVLKTKSPHKQMSNSLRLSELFRQN